MATLHVNLTAKTVTISESLSRAGKGRRRIRKSTKTGGERVLSLNDRLCQMFGDRPQTTPDDLVFTTVTGKPIDDHTFSQKVWKSACLKAGIEYRPPYAARHSLLSHLLEHSASLPQVAYVAGHRNTRMMSEVYAHMINHPQMPDF